MWIFTIGCCFGHFSVAISWLSIAICWGVRFPPCFRLWALALNDFSFGFASCPQSFFYLLHLLHWGLAASLPLQVPSALLGAMLGCTWGCYCWMPWWGAIHELQKNIFFVFSQLSQCQGWPPGQESKRLLGNSLIPGSGFRKRSLCKCKVCFMDKLSSCGNHLLTNLDVV